MVLENSGDVRACEHHRVNIASEYKKEIHGNCFLFDSVQHEYSNVNISIE